jgi:hypothetical protein
MSPIGKQPPDDAPPPHLASKRDDTPPQSLIRVQTREGRPVPDTGTGAGEGYLTEAQWEARDKAAGWVRVDDHGRPFPEDVEYPAARAGAPGEHAGRPIESHDPMSQPLRPGASPGQAQLHRVNTADGQPVPDSGAGAGLMTQEQWRTRDKSQGLVRVDDAGTPLPDQA